MLELGISRIRVSPTPSARGRPTGAPAQPPVQAFENPGERRDLHQSRADAMSLAEACLRITGNAVERCGVYACATGRGSQEGNEMAKPRLIRVTPHGSGRALSAS